jgi:hypothetical protein
VKLLLSDAERSALDWLGGRYEISALLLRHVDDDGLLSVDDDDVALALASDGVDRVPCLSDDTPLQLAVWWVGPAK